MTRIPQTAFREGKVAMFLLQENCNEKLTGFPFKNLLKNSSWKTHLQKKFLLEKMIYTKTNITSKVNVYFTGSLISTSMYDNTKS